MTTLQSEITGLERAIRHLIGERAALNSKLKRLDARLRLERGRLAHQAPAVLKANAHFPDVSSFQPNVNLAAVRNAGGRFGQLAVTKVTEGTGWTDPYGTDRLKKMAQLKFPRRGAYHFLHPGESGSAQAQHMLDTIDHASVTLTKSDVLICDLEVSDGQSPGHIQQCAREFAVTLRKATPCELWLYGGGPFLKENDVTLVGYDAHWLAAYVGDPRPYTIYGARTRFWQYTDGRYGPQPHTAPGVGACDISTVLR